jgi:hypothetical protein
MPFITDTAMQKVATKLQSFETREEKRQIEVRQKLNEDRRREQLGSRARGVHAWAVRDADANFSFRERAFRRISLWD